ncbi:MAG: asparagine synthetase B, partial [Bacteroidetes bacterium]
GFDVPLMKGYKTLLKDWITNDLLSDELLKEQNIWDLKVMQTWRKQILSSNDYDQNRAWAIIAFQYWWKYQKVKTLTPEEHAKLQD